MHSQALAANKKHYKLKKKKNYAPLKKELKYFLNSLIFILIFAFIFFFLLDELEGLFDIGPKLQPAKTEAEQKADVNFTKQISVYENKIISLYKKRYGDEYTKHLKGDYAKKIDNLFREDYGSRRKDIMVKKEFKYYRGHSE